MTAFDTSNPERPVAILTQEQLDALHSFLTGPLAQRITIAEAAATGLGDLGIIDSFGISPEAQPIFIGMESALKHVCSVLVDPSKSESVTNLRISLAPTTATVERTDADGVHVYACDAPEVPHILISNTNLTPTALISDGPPWIPAETLEVLRTGDVRATKKALADTGAQGPEDSLVGEAMREGTWSLALLFDEVPGDGGWTIGHHITLLRTPAMLYQVEAPAFGLDNNTSTTDTYPLTPLPATQAWALIVRLLTINEEDEA